MDEKIPPPVKNDFACWSVSEKMYPPASPTKLVMRPSWNVMSPNPSGTTIFDPFVMTFSEPRTFDPRPAF
ncbi:hypothetical protein [Demequina litorisediminis]|uniref:hypothetical protein n=1 Tax=Demequina litorisediminis TaxID=1849022 RepID=UPI0032AF4DCC